MSEKSTAPPASPGSRSTVVLAGNLKGSILKKYFLSIAFIVLIGCGQIEKSYDEANYESLTNEIGTVKVISGGQIVQTYEGAKILYSDSNAQSLFIQTDAGKKIYIQGDVIIELQD